MKYSFTQAVQILERTPEVLQRMLKDLDPEWVMSNEGGATWSAYDVIGHLVHGENTDWMERVGIILSDRPDKTFRTFDRFAQFEESKGKTLDDLLSEFALLRKNNLEKLKRLNLSEADLQRTGIHPAFGEVTLKQLLATWVVHDLSHIAQISRVMAKLYTGEVGPWVEYFRILKS
jgi:uncharacterized damage-inducible protein DinB